ncbi:MAG: hypothetical protein GY859_03635 [Desulfobacterales bacterium]|nr:hypothetical protein [Desulfobacterales bacterium]
MRKYLIVLGALVVMAIVSMALPGGEQPLAVSGCCKVRQTKSAPWKKTNLSFKECKKRNEKDTDSVLKKSGRVWFDTNCK